MKKLFLILTCLECVLLFVFSHFLCFFITMNYYEHNIIVCFGICCHIARPCEHLWYVSLSVVKLLVCDYILNDICVVGVYESLWPSAVPVFKSYTVTYPCVGKVLWSWVWVGVYLGLAVLVCFSLLVNHTHTHGRVGRQIVVPVGFS